MRSLRSSVFGVRAGWGGLAAVSLLASACWVDTRTVYKNPPPNKEELACEVVSVTPTEDADGVEVSGSITVTYNQAIDATSASDQAKLALLGGKEVPSEVSGKGDTSIVISPAHSLRYFSDYTVSVGDQVKSAKGKTCEPFNQAFQTLVPAEAPKPLRAAPINGGAMIDATHLLVTSSSHRGIQIYDVSTPSAPVLRSELFTKEKLGQIAVDGTTVYIAAAYDGVSIFDVSSPEAPKQIGAASTPDTALALRVLSANGKKYLAIADYRDGLRIVDVTNPLGTFDVWSGQKDAGVVSITLADQLLAAVDASGSVELYDVTNPAAPKILSTTPPAPSDEDFGNAYPALDAAIVGQTLVTLQGAAGMESFDISDPSKPVFVQHLLGPQGKCAANCPDSLLGPSVDGQSVFMASAMTGAVRIIVGADGSLTSDASFDLPGRIQTTIVAGDNLFVGTDFGLGVFDKTSATGATPLYQERQGWGVVNAISEESGKLYAAVGSRGVETYDLSDVLQPKSMNLVVTPGVETDSGLVDISATGSDLLVGDGRSGLTTLSLKNPMAPSIAGTLTIPDQAGRVIQRDSTAYICADNAGVEVVNVSDPSKPTVEQNLVGLNDSVGGCKWLTLVDDTLYFGGGSGVGIIDASKPTNLAIVSFLHLAGNDTISSIAFDESYPNTLFATTLVADWEGKNNLDQRFIAFDITDRKNPKQIFTSGDLGGARSIELEGQKAFVSSGSFGVSVFDLSDPNAPVLEGQIPTAGNAVRTLLSGGTLYVAEGGGGIGAIHVGQLK